MYEALKSYLYVIVAVCLKRECRIEGGFDEVATLHVDLPHALRVVGVVLRPVRTRHCSVLTMQEATTPLRGESAWLHGAVFLRNDT